MTAICREPCCATPRRTVSELLERGLRRNRAAPLPIEGAECRDGHGHGARFSLRIEAGRVAGVGFRVSSCATLIAYCELIAETAPGQRRELAAEMSPRDLVEALPGVPRLKHERAGLAIAALRSALAQTASQQGKADEGRLHLRHPAP